jgi:hypothetical protein
MATYPYLVQIVWDTIEKFLGDWQREPYIWSNELAIQTELASRICSVYKIIGRDTVIGNYDFAVSGFEHNQKWNRVCCKPKIYYQHSDGETHYCFPDIAVWDDIPNPDLPPDATGNSNWPMLWLCEIKVDGKTEENWDIEKMKHLLTQNDVKYACWLDLFIKRTDKGSGIIWKKSMANERLWLCTAMLPPLK